MTKISKKEYHTGFRTSKILNRRRNRINKRHVTVIPWYNTRSCDLKISDLPAGVLINIFSYVPLQDLYLNVRLVCKQWYSLAASATLWKTIAVGPDVPIQMLLSWLENAPKLKALRVQNRLDAGQILRKVYKFNKNIRHIKILDCCGNERRVNLPSAPLCNILTRCPYLNSISLRGSRFISCKFFRILATRDMILEQRKRCIDHTRRSRKIQFYGSALKKQLQIFLKSRLEHNKHKLALLTVEANPVDGASNVKVRQEIIVKNEDDIQRILDTLQYE